MTEQLTASPPQGLPAFAELTDVPFFAQTQYFCGPAALATVLNTSGLEINPEDLAKSIYTPGRQGTLQTEILTGTRRQGRLALPVHDMGEAFMNIAHGRPVLILQNLALELVPQWHYAVLVGFDLPAETVVLRSGTTRRQVMPMTTFEHTWRRAEFWGVVVVGPEGPIPENTSLSAWLHEALGLERAGKPTDALTAFSVAAGHWPNASAPLIAAANILIVQGRLQDAASSLQAAVRRQPDNAVALNNLAHVLMLQGALEAAEKAALKAVEYGGSSEATARETLAAIRARQTN
ncbi:PA2778 family cysteine peptidase [Thalassospiraceae bacterium LMO-JJ14]|nr:PA2778 family cysteine peptidase [Thalassospiraceae bacterium LMO-JJ14]